MFAPVAAVGWAWFGLSGSIPLLLWWWQQRPPPRQAEVWQIDLSEVHGARLGPWRTRISRHRRRPLEIFCDELSPADLARLRRTLKFQLAAGWSTSKRSMEPGNRMVSSPRASVSG